MSLLFVKDVLGEMYLWLPCKKLVAYFLFQFDIIIILLFFILIYEVKRWRRVVRITGQQ